MTAGVTWTPSTKIAIGAKIRNDIIVRILKRLMLSKPSFPAPSMYMNMCVLDQVPCCCV